MRRYRLSQRPDIVPQHQTLAHLDMLTSGAAIDALMLWQQNRRDVKRLELAHEKLNCIAKKVLMHSFWENWKHATGRIGARVIAYVIYKDLFFADVVCKCAVVSSSIKKMCWRAWVRVVCNSQNLMQALSSIQRRNSRKACKQALEAWRVSNALQRRAAVERALACKIDDRCFVLLHKGVHLRFLDCQIRASEVAIDFKAHACVSGFACTWCAGTL